ncbi:MAG TPA: ABC transporter ATP-binding protein [Stellaceae bacterium]|nr:ABC transporter ATP-binding protein [Stellaceae bacterium]
MRKAGMSGAAHGLALSGLTKRYGAVAAIDGIDLEVKPGEFLTVLGPSGSGKSSVLMAIAGFLRPDAGEILLDDRPITNLPAEARNFGLVFQGYALFPHLSVADNIAFPLKVRGIARGVREARVNEVLRLVRLEGVAARKPQELSGGQQQRVALARALVFDPAVLLLDEPLSALDKKLRAELQIELRDLHRRVGGTFINVTHDQEEAITLSDRIAILRNGRLIEIGRPIDLYERPKTRFVADFLGRSNFLEGTVASLAEGMAVIIARGVMLRQAVGDWQDLRPGEPVLVALRPNKIEIACDGRGEGNRLHGEVRSVLYVGSYLELVLRTEIHEALLMTVPITPALRHPREGERLTMSFASDAGVIVGEDRADLPSIALARTLD